MGMQPSDTTDEAREVQFAAYRAMTASQRVVIALQLSDDMRSLSRSGIRWRHPELDERGVHHEFLRILYGSELAAELIAVSARDDSWVSRWHRGAARRR
jgi:hypothetical protein